MEALNHIMGQVGRLDRPCTKVKWVGLGLNKLFHAPGRAEIPDFNFFFF